jgi:hypothetical protein
MHAPLDAPLLERIHELFEAAEIPYALAGRSAAAWWGAPSGTQEVEVVARVEPEETSELLAAAAAHGFEVDGGLAFMAAESGEHLSLFPGSARFVDVKLAQGAADSAALRMRVKARTPRGPFWVASLEETIARLLDEETTEAIALAAKLWKHHFAGLDPAYLGQRCEELGVTRLLREIEDMVAPPTP